MILSKKQINLYKDIISPDIPNISVFLYLRFYTPLTIRARCVIIYIRTAANKDRAVISSFPRNEKPVKISRVFRFQGLDKCAPVCYNIYIFMNWHLHVF